MMAKVLHYRHGLLSRFAQRNKGKAIEIIQTILKVQLKLLLKLIHSR